MAFQLTQAPVVTINLMRSPIIATLRETDSAIYNDVTFRYSVRVKLWEGLITSPPTGVIVELIRTPDSSNLGMFNISPVIQDSIVPSQPFVSGFAGVKFCQLIYGTYLNGTYTEHLVGNAFWVLDGWAEQQELINQYQDFTPIRDNKHFLTNRRKYQVIEGLKAYVHSFRGVIDDRIIRYTDEEGNSFDVAMPTVGTLGRFPIGYEQVMAIASGGFDPQRRFTVDLLDDYSEELYDRITVEIISNSFCDIAPDCIAFYNRFGVWDYIHCRGRTREKTMQTRSTWNRRIAFYESNRLVYVAGTSEQGNTGIRGTKEYTVNTGFLDQSVNDSIDDMLLSKVHYSELQDKGLVLKTDSIELRTNSDSNLISYQFNFELAGNLIQSIE
jgi:hypothetical protein